MSTLSLAEPPPDIREPSVWLHGEPGAPAVGDLWLLSWNTEGLGVAVVSAVLSGYVLVWPASLPDDDAYMPAVHVSTSPLGIPVDVWPTRETGVNMAVLHRRLGHLLEPRLMAVVGDALDEGADPPLPFAAPRPEVAATTERDHAMVDHWESVCLTEWPRPVAARLGRDVAKRLAITPSILVRLLGVGPREAAALVLGKTELSSGQVQALADALGVESAEFGSTPSGDSVRALLDPMWKEDVLAVAEKTQLDEPAARDFVVTECELDARSSSDIEGRLRAVFDRLLRTE